MSRSDVRVPKKEDAKTMCWCWRNERRERGNKATPAMGPMSAVGDSGGGLWRPGALDGPRRVLCMGEVVWMV